MEQLRLLTGVVPPLVVAGADGVEVAVGALVGTTAFVTGVGSVKDCPVLVVQVCGVVCDKVLPAAALHSAKEVIFGATWVGVAVLMLGDVFLVVTTTAVLCVCCCTIIKPIPPTTSSAASNKAASLIFRLRAPSHPSGFHPDPLDGD